MRAGPLRRLHAARDTVGAAPLLAGTTLGGEEWRRPLEDIASAHRLGGRPPAAVFGARPSRSATGAGRRATAARRAYARRSSSTLRRRPESSTAAGVRHYTGPSIEADRSAQPPSALEGHDVFELVHPTISSSVAQRCARLLSARGETVRIQYRVRHAHGRLALDGGHRDQPPRRAGNRRRDRQRPRPSPTGGAAEDQAVESERASRWPSTAPRTGSGTAVASRTFRVAAPCAKWLAIGPEEARASAAVLPSRPRRTTCPRSRRAGANTWREGATHFEAEYRYRMPDGTYAGSCAARTSGRRRTPRCGWWVAHDTTAARPPRRRRASARRSWRTCSRRRE